MQEREKGSLPGSAAQEGPVQPSRLTNSIAFQLRLAQSASFQAYAERASEPGLRPGRYAILQFIAENPGISQTELSQAVGRDKTTLTPTLADLERRGLIVRAPDPKDGRARCLSLTVSGHSLLERLANHARLHNRRIDDILGADRDLLLSLLIRLTRGLDSGSGSNNGD